MPCSDFFGQIRVQKIKTYFNLAASNKIYLSSISAGRKIFREFLRSEYSEENMLFWLACEELKKEENPEVVEEKARLIYEDYISILSPKEVKSFWACL